MAESRGLRGSVLEEMINLSNTMYRDKGLGMIQKIPTPITPIHIDKENRHITLAYFDQKSTVDYIGAVQGIPVCFDAKECRTDQLPLRNIHAHQIQFMEDFERQQGVAFLIVYFTKRDALYYLPYRTMMEFVNRAESGGVKHIKLEELDERYRIRSAGGIMVHYLEQIQTDLTDREEQG